MHHIKRLSLSAGEDANNPSNLAILCRCCHARHTEEEQLALGDTRPLTIESQVSNRVKHLLDSTNPPPQIVWGQRQKAKHKKPRILFRFIATNTERMGMVRAEQTLTKTRMVHRHDCLQMVGPY